MNTLATLRKQAERVNKFFNKKVFEIGQRNGFKYFDFVDHNKSPLFNSALSNKVLSENISAFYEGLIFKLTDRKTIHFICTVNDSINNYDEIASYYCDVYTVEEAKTYFLNHSFIKKHMGRERYQISIKQNPILLQDSHEYLKNWTKLK